jgi:D-lactate dehydrogenase
VATIAFISVEPWHKDYLQSKLKGHKAVFIDEPLTVTNASKAKDADILAVFIYSPITAALIAKLPNLRHVTTMSTGFDHIDLKACAKRGIAVSNVPAYGDNTVAEHTFALMLTVTRKIVESVERTKRGHFEFEGLLGMDLKGKTLGVVGTGRIGRNVAHIGGEGFGMKVIAFDVFQNKEWAKECGVEYVPLDRLYAESDVISFHVPLTPDTTKLLNVKNISKVKKGAIVINTARGQVIETKALVDGLKKGILSGVGLDVLENECAIKEKHPMLADSKEVCLPKELKYEMELLKHPRAYVTPHSAFYSKEAVQRILDTTCENIAAFAAKKPVNLVK